MNQNEKIWMDKLCTNKLCQTHLFIFVALLGKLQTVIAYVWQFMN